MRELILAGRADHHAEPFAEVRQAERAAIVAWLRQDNGQCDCHAREATECACGAWDDYKTRPLLDIATAIETGEHLKDSQASGDGV
jgi:hypothetical protein